MSHTKNKVEWCLRKAERELKESYKHRGLVKVKPDLEKANDFIIKAEHYLKATEYLKKGNFSDISASTVFYAMYHCLLAIAAKFGYESENQECTFAVINNLIEDGKIDFEKKLLDKISSLEVNETDEKTIVEVREKYQYGTELNMEDEDLYFQLVELAKTILSKAKVIIME
jgi:uncharacterized protein (UPF0332 family)